MTNAASAAYNAFRLVYANPAQEQMRAAFHSRIQQYDLLWSYYDNSVFDVAEKSWQGFRANQGLYRNTRALYNPTKRLVDFYAGQIYPGVLSTDGENLPENVRLAIPFAQDTDPALTQAIAQFWEWSAWQKWKNTLPRWCAALGSTLVEIVDEPQKGMIYANVVWPSHVIDLKLDNQGRIKSYIIEYLTEEPLPWAVAQTVAIGVAAPYRQYRYRKEVDLTSVRFYKDGTPWDYTTATPNGPGAVTQNIYGFVPAVWFKHSDVGGIHGQPAIAGSLNKINELNSKASQLNDYIGKAIAAPAIITSDRPLAGLTTDPNAPGYTQGGKGGQKVKRPATDDYGPEANQNRESLGIISAPQGTEVKSLVGTLDIASTMAVLKSLYEEIENDNPEITFWAKLQAMGQVTGPAVSMLSGDVASRVQEAAALYDHASKELFGMAVAIGGMRANNGDWQTANDGWGLNRQQAKFALFDLDSLTNGDLDFEIMPRPLMPPTKSDQATERQQYWAGVSAETAAGIPLEMALAEDGWSTAKLARLKSLNEEKQARALELAQASTPAAGQQEPDKSGSQNNDSQTTSNNVKKEGKD